MGTGSLGSSTNRHEAVSGKKQIWQSGTRYFAHYESMVDGAEVVQRLDINVETSPGVFESPFPGVFPVESRHPLPTTTSTANGFAITVSTRSQLGDAYSLRVFDAVLSQGATTSVALDDLTGLCHEDVCSSDLRYYFATGLDYLRPFEFDFEFLYSGDGGKGERSRIEFGAVYLEETTCFICEDELSRMDEAMQEAHDRLADIEERLEFAHADLANARTELRDASDLIAMLEAERRSLQEEVVGLKSEVTDLEASIALSNDKIVDLMHKLEHSSADLTSQLAAVQGELDRCQTDLGQAGRSAPPATDDGCTCVAASGRPTVAFLGMLSVVGLAGVLRRRPRPRHQTEGGG